jgi:hypothetical protein
VEAKADVMVELEAVQAQCEVLRNERSGHDVETKNVAAQYAAEVEAQTREVNDTANVVKSLEGELAHIVLARKAGFMRVKKLTNAAAQAEAAFKSLQREVSAEELGTWPDQAISRLLEGLAGATPGELKAGERCCQHVPPRVWNLRGEGEGRGWRRRRLGQIVGGIGNV